MNVNKLTLPHFIQFFRQSAALEAHTEPEEVTLMLLSFTPGDK